MPNAQPDINALSDSRTVLTKCGGWYECRRNEKGDRISPLVGYAGRYEPDKQYVGDVFINTAKLEQWPDLMNRHVVGPLSRKIARAFPRHELHFVGLPEGGKTLAALLALRRGFRYTYPEKVEVSPATETSRAVTDFRYLRHEISTGDSVILVEDVCNNFSTTGKTIDLMHALGAHVLGIACFLNRSSEWTEFYVHGDESYPVLAKWSEPFPEYRQDDYAVAHDIGEGNVVWKPKDEWSRLQDKMNGY